MSRQQFATLLGFAFAAVWVAGDLGDAVLCLIGAAAFWAVDAYLRGELDSDRLLGRREGRDPLQ